MVQLPNNVVAAWVVTNQFKVGVLSKKCQVQAHIALTSDGNMPQDIHRQAGKLRTFAKRHTRKMAVIHSTTLEM
jgi:hypothetical protein